MGKTKFLTALLSMIMLLALCSLTAFAGVNPVQVDKKATLENDGTYSIELSAYATGSVTTDTIPVPTDIVLVLDYSSSMSENNMTDGSLRIDALKAAVRTFIDETEAKNAKITDTTKQHRISIVTYNTTVTNITKTKYGTDFVTVNSSASASTLKSYLDTDTSTGTRTDLGLQEAKDILDRDTDTGRAKVVILFSDGAPTDVGRAFINEAADDGDGSARTYLVSSKAMPIAKSIKDSGALMYSIGVFSGADPAVTSGANQNTFLNMVSSNYPEAEITRTVKTIGNYTYASYSFSLGTGSYTDGYYKTADSSADLADVFTEISESIDSSTVTLDADSILRDTINAGLDASDADVKVYTAAYQSDNSFSETLTDITDDVTATVTPKDKENYGYDTVEVVGFSYKGNYCVINNGTAKGKKLIVKITGIRPTDAAATGSVIKTNVNDLSGIYQDSSATEPVAYFPVPTTIITKKAYVLDFGKKVQLDAFDWSMDQEVTYICGGFDINTAASDTYGTLVDPHANPVAAYNLVYTPKTMQWGGYDSYYIFGYTGDKNVLACSANEVYNALWSKVTVMPATSVYYEDTFVSTDATSSTKATVGIVYDKTWEVATEPSDDYQSSDNKNYGTDASYEDSWTDSNGTAAKAVSDYTIDDDENITGTISTATFTFKGTGVDIYSRTDMKQGVIGVTLTKVNGTAKDDKVYYVDNMYEGSDGTLYNIPTASFTGLDYGTYSVKIEVANGDLTGGRNTYYLDGIRVYNPANELEGSSSDTTVYDAYSDAGENNAYVQELRDILLEAGSLGSDGTKAGAVYIAKDDASTGTISTYENYGPKHEVYLNPGDTVAFTIKSTLSTDSEVYVGMKVPAAGADKDVTVNGSQVVTVKSATDMYYSVTPNSSKQIVITNNSSSKVALTKVKITKVAAGRKSTLVANGALAKFAWNMKDLLSTSSVSSEGNVGIVNANEVVEDTSVTSNAIAADLYDSVSASADAYLN